jgi:hypothetical protein
LERVEQRENVMTNERTHPLHLLDIAASRNGVASRRVAKLVSSRTRWVRT